MARWFRMYEEALNDPKVQRLDGETFKAWVNLLCVASARNGMICNAKGNVPCNVSETAFCMRMDEIAFISLVDRLLIAGLFDVCKGGATGSYIAPHGWDKRQYKSDISTPRVKRFRERFRNVSETPPETETDIDSSSLRSEETASSLCSAAVGVVSDTPPPPPPEKSKSKKEPKEPKEPKSRRMTRIDPNWIQGPDEYQVWEDSRLPMDALDIEWPKFIDYHQAKGSLMADWMAAWRMWVRNCLKFEEERRRREQQRGQHHPNYGSRR